NRARVPLVFVRRVEGKAAYRVFDADEVLEFERNEIWRTHQEQVVGNDLRIDAACRDSMAVIPIAHLFAPPVIEFSESISCLRSAPCQQRFERRTHVIRRILMENNAPARFVQLERINAESNSEHRGKQLVRMVKC